MNRFILACIVVERATCFDESPAQDQTLIKITTVNHVIFFLRSFNKKPSTASEVSHPRGIIPPLLLSLSLSLFPLPLSSFFHSERLITRQFSSDSDRAPLSLRLSLHLYLPLPLARSLSLSLSLSCVGPSRSIRRGDCSWPLSTLIDV